MFFGEPDHYLFKMPLETAEPIAHMPWPALCRHVERFSPQAWLPELEEIAFFQLGKAEEVFAFGGCFDIVESWEASLDPFFSQPDAQCHFASLHLARVTPEDLRRLMAGMQEAIAGIYEDAIVTARRKKRWGKENELHRPPDELDVTKNFCSWPDFPRLVPYHPMLLPWQAFDLLWLCKRTDWAHEALVHVYG